MNSYLTKLNKSNHTEWKKMNQIKSNQINTNTRRDLHNMGLTSMKIIWNQFHFIYQQYSILISIEYSPNESSGLTFWNRFGISNYHPYSIFRSTYQCHQNKDNKNYILQNWEYIVFSFGKYKFNHFDPYQSLLLMSTNRNHHPPSFSPTLQYPISQTTHFFFLIPFIISFNHS